MSTVLPKLTKQDATAVVLECVIRSTERLFDERFDADGTITPENLQILREVRNTQLDRLRENLRYARKTAR